MNVVIEGIYNYFVATSAGIHNTAYNAVGGRFYLVEAPQNSTFPYIVWHIITNDGQFNFTSDKAELVIQFDVHSSTATAQECGTIIGYLKTLYHKKSPTITGYRVVSFREDNLRGPLKFEDTDFWVYQARYLLKIEPSS